MRWGVRGGLFPPRTAEYRGPRLVRSRTVQQGLVANAWVQDIAGPLTFDAVVQFFGLWNQFQQIVVHDDEGDRFQWKPMANSEFSTRSAYRMFFGQGASWSLSSKGGARRHGDSGGCGGDGVELTKLASVATGRTTTGRGRHICETPSCFLFFFYFPLGPAIFRDLFEPLEQF